MSRGTIITLMLMAASFAGCSAGEPLTEPQGEWSAVNAGQPPPVDPTAQYPVPLLPPPPIADAVPQATPSEALPAPSPPRQARTQIAAPEPQDHEIHLGEADTK